LILMNEKDPNRWKFSLLMNETIRWTFTMFWDEFDFIHEFDWNSSTQVYEWKFIYSSSGVHGQNKSLDHIPWMKFNSSWNTMNSHLIISFMN
jgi:hypothetical protein